MARNPFVKPEVVRLDLAEGDWVDVKKHLTAGEEARMSGAGLRQMTQEEGKPAFFLDFEKLRMAQVETYVVAWSFVNEKGNQTKPTPENISALSGDVLKEIGDAIDEHVKRMTEEKSRPPSAPVGVTN
jgi:hypothetical protein